MKLLFTKENNPTENRVSITPDLVAKYQKLGFEVLVESGAGVKSSIGDSEYLKAGASTSADLSSLLKLADIIVSIQRTDFDFSLVKKDAIFITKERFVRDGINCFALDLIPRITRAQSMDILSSQSNLAGYRAVIDAAYEMQKITPMMMTAAGTISAAKFMIIGAGVAGLQAIATAKRLGAVVCAFDVRSAAKEQVQSLGAKFIEVKSEEKNDGVYAKEMSEEYRKLQQQLLKDTIKNQDVVITTALIPGKKAPILITEEMVGSMKPGSIIVDIAAVNGGNCELTQAGKSIEIGGVKIIGHDNFPARVASDASKVFAKNIFNFVDLLVDKEKKEIFINREDEIIKTTLSC
jgi:NAD(P) transhydrogenase subunit alpha